MLDEPWLDASRLSTTTRTTKTTRAATAAGITIIALISIIGIVEQHWLIGPNGGCSCLIFDKPWLILADDHQQQEQERQLQQEHQQQYRLDQGGDNTSNKNDNSQRDVWTTMTEDRSAHDGWWSRIQYWSSCRKSWLITNNIDNVNKNKHAGSLDMKVTHVCMYACVHACTYVSCQLQGETRMEACARKRQKSCRFKRIYVYIYIYF